MALSIRSIERLPKRTPQCRAPTYQGRRCLRASVTDQGFCVEHWRMAHWLNRSARPANGGTWYHDPLRRACFPVPKPTEHYERYAS